MPQTALTQIYRLEHSTKKRILKFEKDNTTIKHYVGPFHTMHTLGSSAIRAFYVPAAGLSAFSPYDMPEPIHDGITEINATDITGCTTLRKLRDWFPNKNGLERLLFENFIVRCYTVPKVNTKKGSTQIMFDVKSIQNVAQVDSAKLLNPINR